MVILVSTSKVLQIDCDVSYWVCSKQSLIQFVSSLIEINFHARIDARLAETGSIWFFDTHVLNNFLLQGFSFLALV
jgi:hypothetical protein